VGPFSHSIATEENAMTVARELAKRIHAFRYEDLPDDALFWAKQAIIDTVGVTFAGSIEPTTRIPAGVPGIAEQEGPSLIFGTDRRTAVLDAVLVNGTASHALDYDDVSPTLGGHPSAMLVPPIIALGEMLGTSGKDAVTAYVAGYEVETRIARAVHFEHYEKGWHPTATLGIFGATAAAARLLGLDEEQTERALAIAVSLASGVKANFGTMTKPLHVGQATRNGVFAAFLAKDEFTASAEAFERKQGFFEVFNGPGKYDADKVFENWADPLDIVDPGLGIKQFPCCGSTHMAISMMLNLVEKHGLTPEMVRHIQIYSHPQRLPHQGVDQPFRGRRLGRPAGAGAAEDRRGRPAPHHDRQAVVRRGHRRDEIRRDIVGEDRIPDVPRHPQPDERVGDARQVRGLRDAGAAGGSNRKAVRHAGRVRGPAGYADADGCVRRDGVAGDGGGGVAAPATPRPSA
jgi:hypothetical protein